MEQTVNIYIAPKNLYFWVILQYFEGPAAAAASVEVTATIRPAIRRTHLIDEKAPFVKLNRKKIRWA